MKRNRTLQRLLALALVVSLLTALGAGAFAAEPETGEISILLSDDGITVNGEAVSEDPDAAVYTGAEIIYYHDLDTYESGNLYGEGTEDERHTEEEAAAHTCLTITQAGTYRLSGTLSAGQIVVDLGEDAVSDPTAVVTLILDDVSVTCTVAPALIVYNVYECDTAWTAYDNEETDSYEASSTQDTSDAGINIILADGSVNTFTGSHVARIYKDTDAQKKLYKYDGAFYSVQSMNIDGEEDGDGVLNIIADNEGLDTEQHLTINGGVINIQSQDDGINTNEDNVSVTTINGGSLHIVAGLGSEGDGIDSNGYLVINGGTVIALAKPESDSGLDSDMGSYINGGYVIATGSAMDWAESDSEQVTLNLQFAASQAADEAIILTDTDGNVIFAYDPEKDEAAGGYSRGYQGAIISCPELQVGEAYYIYVGGDVYGEETSGLYDVSTVTGFSEDAVQQQYSGTEVGMGGGPGGMGGGPDGGAGAPGGMNGPDGGAGGGTDGSGSGPDSGAGDPGAGGTDGGLEDTLSGLLENSDLTAFLTENGDTLRTILQENAETLQTMAEAFDGSVDDFLAEYGETLQAILGDNYESFTALLEAYADELQELLDAMSSAQNGGSAPENGGNPDDGLMYAAEGETPDDAPADTAAPQQDGTPAAGEGPAEGKAPDGQGAQPGPESGQDGQPQGGQPGQEGGQPGQDNRDGGTASVTFTLTDKVNSFSGVSDYTPGSSAGTGFADVPQNAWYADGVAAAVEQGLMTGVSDSSFAPDVALTRGDLAEALYVLSGSPAEYADALSWAQACSWWSGEADDTLTRAELAVCLYAWAGGEAAQADLSSFTDGSSVPEDAAEAVAWAVASGILEGDDQGALQPDSTVTHAQAAVIFAYRLQ